MFLSRIIALFSLLLAGVSAFSPLRVSKALRPLNADMIEITPGVKFDTIAREWRLKWSADSDKKSLQSVQQTLTIFEKELSKLPGLKSVQRIVCGGCLDYKVIIALKASEFGNWEAKKFQPEEQFLSAVKSIQGVSVVETQTYTIMPVM
jgi:hypothetical protein